MYLNNDLTSEPIIINRKGEKDLLPYYNNITTDVILIPQFHSTIRTYEVKFYGTDLENPFYTGIYNYGTPYQDLQPNEIPYREYSGTNLTAAYDFKGYSLIQGASNLVPSAYTLTNNQNFYAVFEFVDDIRKVVHPEWFQFGDETYRQDLNYDYVINPLPEIKGYNISPKVKLKGKITLPAMYNNKPVIKIASQFAGVASGEHDGTEIQHEITHIFCEEGSQLREIGANAFYKNLTLQHFDFSLNTVRFIDRYAFCQCSALDAARFSLSNQIWYIGYQAFNAAFKQAGSPVTLKIPSSVIIVHDYGFAYLNIPNGSTLQVGDVDDFSNLDLTKPALSSDSLQKFVSNEGVITTYYFYSNLYNAAMEEINNSGYQVQNAFIGNNIGATLQVFKGANK